VPGTSNALAIAERFGIPRDVIEVAVRVLPERTRTFEDLVRQLEDQRRGLEIERAGLAEERERVGGLRKELERAREELQARDRRQLTREAERLMAGVRRARDDLRAARQRIRREKPEERELMEAKEIIERATREASTVSDETRAEQEAPVGRRATDEDLAAGTLVYVTRLRTQATVVEAANKGRVRVAAGAMKLWVGSEEVRLLDPTKQPAPAATSPRPV